MSFSLYGTAFSLMSAFLFFFVFVRIFAPSDRYSEVLRVVEIFVVLLTIGIVSFDIANRPIDMEGDTAVYIGLYNDMSLGLENPFQRLELGFIGGIDLFTSMGLDYTYFFYAITFVFLWSYYLLIRKVFGYRSSWTLLVFGLVLFYPFFFSLTANIIRQGLAMSMINFALILSINGKWKQGGIVTIIAALFHKSSVVFLPFFVLRKLILKVSIYILILLWVCVSLASYFKIFALMVSVAFEYLSNYGVAINYSDSENISYITGFRWDFWLFSSLAVILLMFLKLLGCIKRSEVYIFYITAYLACFHIAMFDVAYNDRFGIYAWIYYPISISYVLRAVYLNLTKRPLS